MENNVQGRTLKKRSGKVFPTILLILAVLVAFSTILFQYLSFFMFSRSYGQPYNGIFGHIENLTQSGITNFLAALFLPVALFAALQTNKKSFAIMLLIVGLAVMATQIIAGIVCLIAQHTGIFTEILPLSYWIFGSRFLLQLFQLFRNIPQFIARGYSGEMILFTFESLSALLAEGLFLLETSLCVICAAVMVLKKKRV